MTFMVVAHLFSALLDFLSLFARSEREKDLVILLLRKPSTHFATGSNLSSSPFLVGESAPGLLAGKLVKRVRHSCTRLSQSLLLFTSETVLRWHRSLVRHKWTFRHRRSVGRPRIAVELETLIVRLARENPRWGYGKIEGELRKLGYRVGRSTIRAVLKRQHIPAAPVRARQSST